MVNISNCNGTDHETLGNHSPRHIQTQTVSIKHKLNFNAYQIYCHLLSLATGINKKKKPDFSIKYKEEAENRNRDDKKTTKLRSLVFKH